jgi:hypothetical protein
MGYFPAVKRKFEKSFNAVAVPTALFVALCGGF